MRKHFAVVSYNDDRLVEEVSLFHDETKALLRYNLENADPCDCYYHQKYDEGVRLLSWEADCIYPVQVQVTSEAKSGSSISVPALFIPSYRYDGLVIPSCDQVWDSITGLEEALSE